ncbi:uncharacterized protein LOC118746413 [Rhagoletis pomonella]|uniref:uncharacterized protein LOC118746413 n=1 Tax=Rhagoletis pomonella TaxID=28610 RepID=UPI00177CC0B3|nr:uncharacterized protein LOC118746413 [Rhagoletis pomonella]
MKRISKQKGRFRGSENPRASHQHQLHPSRCTVRCGVIAENVIGPYFFENEDETPETISGACYSTKIDNFLRLTGGKHSNLWCQQYGATAHTARQTMDRCVKLFKTSFLTCAKKAIKTNKIDCVEGVEQGNLLYLPHGTAAERTDFLRSEFDQNKSNKSLHFANGGMHNFFEMP